MTTSFKSTEVNFFNTKNLGNKKNQLTSCNIEDHTQHQHVQRRVDQLHFLIVTHIKVTS